MPSFSETLELIKKGAKDAKAKDDAVRANPALAKTPEMKKRYRTTGTLSLVFGLALLFASYVGYQETGRVLIMVFSASIVLVFGGLWMALTGTNPFMRTKK